MTSFLKKLSALGLLSLVCGTANAVTLDWDTAAWANGSLSNSYDVDPAVVGNDITVTVSGSTAQLVASNGAGSPPTPAITVALEGGLSPVQKNLELALNLTNQTQQVTISVSFSALYIQGVQNVSFSIFDVDFSSGNFQDQLRSIVAVSSDGLTQIAPTITTSSSNSLSGTGLTQVVTGIATSSDTGAGSANGNVTISFGSNAIKSFSFVYGSGTNAPVDPAFQHIGLHDISFTPVPELNPAWLGGCSCLIVGFFFRRHHARLRK